VALGQAEGDLVEGGLHGGDLDEDVGAPAVLLDHALDAAHLALDPPQPVVELLLGGAVAAFGGHGVTIPQGGTRGSRVGRPRADRRGMDLGDLLGSLLSAPEPRGGVTRILGWLTLIGVVLIAAFVYLAYSGF
jgi:hypothetical protein